MLDKFFDFIFNLPLIRKFRPFYEKRKDIVLYLFFGVLTTIVGVFTFWLFYYVFSMSTLTSIIISGVLAVTFAFLTNRIWVFNSPTEGKKDFFVQMGNFYGGRLFSLGVETLLLFVFVDKLCYNAMLIKILANVVVLILNYIISKLFVFRKKEEE